VHGGCDGVRRSAGAKNQRRCFLRAQKNRNESEEMLAEALMSRKRTRRKDMQEIWDMIVTLEFQYLEWMDRKLQMEGLRH
jgi:hypothetical protein